MPETDHRSQQHRRTSCPVSRSRRCSRSWPWEQPCSPHRPPWPMVIITIIITGITTTAIGVIIITMGATGTTIVGRTTTGIASATGATSTATCTATGSGHTVAARRRVATEDMVEQHRCAKVPDCADERSGSPDVSFHQTGGRGTAGRVGRAPRRGPGRSAWLASPPPSSSSSRSSPPPPWLAAFVRAPPSLDLGRPAGLGLRASPVHHAARRPRLSRGLLLRSARRTGRSGRLPCNPLRRRWRGWRTAPGRGARASPAP